MTGPSSPPALGSDDRGLHTAHHAGPGALLARATGGRLDAWALLAGALALLLLLPILQLGGDLLAGLAAPVTLSGPRLQRYVVNTTLLMAGVGAFAVVSGVGTAWLTTAYRFPGRDWIGWTLALPLAIPSYISAYAYSGMFDFAGPLQTPLRRTFGPEVAAWVPHELVTSIWGLMVVMGSVLYPYVYLISRASFRLQSSVLIEASQLFGQSRGQTFWRVALPLARPAIVAGLGLVLMETLNEFGAPQYFGVETLCTGVVYRWELDDEPGRALRLAALLVLMVAFVAGLERAQRGAQVYARRQMDRPLEPARLTGWRGLLATLACLTPLTLGFLLPVAQLLYWSRVAVKALDASFLDLMGNSFTMAAAAAVVTTLAALALSYARRVTTSRVATALTRAAVLGYAVPGVAIALGALSLALAADDLLAADRLLVTGSLLAVVWAYATRFVAVAHGAVESGFERIGPHVEEAARSLGAGPLRTLWSVSLPMVRRSVLAAAVLVFVDVLKELPLTLMMRPFDYDTLAIRAYQLASDEQLAEAAAPALVIVALGLAPVAIAHHLTNR